MLSMHSRWKLIINERSLISQWDIAPPFGAFVLPFVLGWVRTLKGVVVMLVWQARV